MTNLFTIFLQKPDSEAGLREPEHASRIAKAITRSMALGVASILACSVAIGAAPDSDEKAQAQWREGMINSETPGGGCFHASFPSTLWEAVPCRAVQSHTHPIPRLANSGEPQTTGNSNDYALVSPGGLISKTVGSFPAVTGVTSESNVGVRLFGYGGELGSNEYSLQLNTNANARTSACSGGAPECTVWQQFIYATDPYPLAGHYASVFMQYWLINYGASGARCPGGYMAYGNSCYMNSAGVEAPDVPIAGLGNLKLTGSAVPGGYDTVIFANGAQAYSASAFDEVLQIATVWQESEFNVLGDFDGSEAVFSPGAAITVNVAAQYGSIDPPACPSNAGTTGESNNLTLGPCAIEGGLVPGGAIQFTESSPSDTLVPGETIAPGQFIVSQSGHFELVLQTNGDLVLYELPNMLALWTSGTQGENIATCIMQTDGNLVLYSPTGSPIWASNTNGNPGSRLVAQSDGNVVIYRSNNTPVWASNTVVPTGPTATGSTMTAGQVLYPGQSIKSPHGRFELLQQTDGDLVLHDLLWGLSLWASGTYGEPVAVCIMQTDGNLVQYAAGTRPLWASNTSGNPGAYLSVQDDGNVVIYRSNGTAAWATNTQWATNTTE